jgi:hypothetical protein
MENILNQIAKEFQKVMEEKFKGQTIGSCYLSGHCLSIIFNELGFKSRKVTGRLALLLKKGKNRYATYGRFALKRIDIGIYHTWSEVKFNDETFIVDTSLKVNLKFTKKHFRIKFHPMVVRDILVTKSFNNYYYKYREDKSLEKLSNQSLEILTNDKTINYLINKTIENIHLSGIRQSA